MTLGPEDTPAAVQLSNTQLQHLKSTVRLLVLQHLHAYASQIHSVDTLPPSTPGHLASRWTSAFFVFPHHLPSIAQRVHEMITSPLSLLSNLASNEWWMLPDAIQIDHNPNPNPSPPFDTALLHVGIALWKMN